MPNLITGKFLKTEGTLLKYNEELGASLIEYNDTAYVVFFNEDYMTQEEDNQFGPDNAIFPDEN